MNNNFNDHTYKVVIIGAGFAGIGAAVKLKEAGFLDFIVLEKASELGGVWRDNTYPDCGCDLPSPFYSYSFAPNPNWSRAFALQPEIKSYLYNTANKSGILPHFVYNTEVGLVRWKAGDQLWEIQTNQGRYWGQYVITACGTLHEPNIPQFKGIESFKGEVFHSSRWKHEVDLKGKKVAVIGTGASAVQFVPAIQPFVGKLSIFQRTPHWVLPKSDFAISPGMQRVFKYIPVLQKGLRNFAAFLNEFMSATIHNPDKAVKVHKMAYKNLVKGVKDPELRKKLTPNYSVGCKRLLTSSNWYPAVSQPNVEVVVENIQSVSPKGIVDEKGMEHPADVIIYATGFDTTFSKISARIYNERKQSLSDVWQGTPQAYLGTVVSGFPNLFLMVGPNVSLAVGSILMTIESQLTYIIDLLKKAEAQSIAQLSVKSEVQTLYNQEVQRALQNTVFNRGGCHSYFFDKNGVNCYNWPWKPSDLPKRLKTSDLKDFNTSTVPVKEEEDVTLV